MNTENFLNQLMEYLKYRKSEAIENLCLTDPENTEKEQYFYGVSDTITEIKAAIKTIAIVNGMGDIQK